MNAVLEAVMYAMLSTVNTYYFFIFFIILFKPHSMKHHNCTSCNLYNVLYIVLDIAFLKKIVLLPVVCYILG